MRERLERQPKSKNPSHQPFHDFLLSKE